ncbi:hypothetical protein GCM10008085_22620 [Winogradskyella epiphytica]|nr:hypothetical protein GCM10008085_22620 [Winogradskyella epiphytica]
MPNTINKPLSLVKKLIQSYHFTFFDDSLYEFNPLEKLIDDCFDAILSKICTAFTFYRKSWRAY